MESKEKLFTELGFSDQFLNEIGNNFYENSFEDSDMIYQSFDNIDSKEFELTSLFIEKTEEPLSLNNIY